MKLGETVAAVLEDGVGSRWTAPDLMQEWLEWHSDRNKTQNETKRKQTTERGQRIVGREGGSAFVVAIAAKRVQMTREWLWCGWSGEEAGWEVWEVFNMKPKIMSN